jgi:hypothetical protein
MHGYDHLLEHPLGFTDRRIIEALKQIALMYIYGTCAVDYSVPRDTGEGRVT